jgi:hypothetical protein
MLPRPAFRTILVVVPFALTACGEHAPDGPGPDDQTPPGIIAVVAWDSTHVEVAFDEELTRWTAENPANYRFTSYSPRATSASPREAVAISEVRLASLHEDLRTVTLTTAALQSESLRILVTGVSDTHGNRIVKTSEYIFEGTDAADTTPPELAYRLPAPGARGISTRTFITVGFSEAVQYETVSRGLRVHGDGARLSFIRHEDPLHFTGAVDSLQPEASCTVVLTGIRDLAGNLMPETQWSFHTQASDDVTAPTVISSQPANHSLHVDVRADLSLTFSEPMDPYSVILRPRVASLHTQWSYGGRRVTFDTEWLPGRQYTVQIRPGEMSDQAGNVNADLFTLVFSTAEALESGSFSGRITGDPRSARANDPTGGLVFAGATPDDLYASVVAMVGASDAYEVSHLPDGIYYPFCVIDSDGNRMYQPRFGDAIGVYGIPDWFSPGDPRAVEVTGGRITGVDFGVYDPTAVFGLVAYAGLATGPTRVGLFRSDGFDPLASAPVVAVTAQWDGQWDYMINTLDTGPIPDDHYYVMAFIDTNADGAFDPSSDPMGFHGGATPIAIDLSHGRDAAALDLVLHDPVAMTAGRIPWPDAPRSSRLRAIERMLGAAGAP